MEIRIYIEGGGDSKDGKAFLRQGFARFFRSLVESARQQRTRWQIVTCGPRNAAFAAFRSAIKQHAEAFNVLLVDSETAVRTQPWNHLQQQDGWIADDLSGEHCHLMVQAMEAWLVADAAALAKFYGQGFHPNSLPNRPDIERITPDQLATALKNATRETQKGEYHKGQHAWKILEVIDPALVRQAAPHCERLFATLEARLSEP